MTREQELVIAIQKAQELKSSLKEKSTSCQKDLDKAQDELGALMEAQGKTTTAKYEGVGFVTLGTPKIRASYHKEDEAKVFEYLRGEGRDDMIKESVHPSSLSSFVKELIQVECKNPPDCINHYLQPQVKFFAR